MLSRELLRNAPERVEAGLRARGADLSLLERWRELDERRRALIAEVEERKRQRNAASARIGELKRSGGSADEEIAAVSQLKGEIESGEAALGETEAAERIESAVRDLVREGKSVTGDLGGTATTTEYTDALVAAVAG